MSGYTKRIAGIALLWLVCLVARGQVTNTVRLQDFTTANTAYRQIAVYPLSAPTTNNSSVVISERKVYRTDATGTFVITNQLAGCYKFEAFNWGPITPFYICFTNQTGNINASDHITSIVATTAADAVYVRHAAGLLSSPTNFLSRNILAGSNLVIATNSGGQITLSVSTNISQSLGYTNSTEIWLSTRTDRDGIGTYNDPRRADTRSAFDAIMSAYASTANVTFRLHPGRYLTKGYSPSSQITDKWAPNTGWRIVGSGMDSTVLARDVSYTSPLTNDLPFVVIGNGYDADTQKNRVEVRDLTIDCGGTLAPTYAGAVFDAIRLNGSESKIVNVRATNWFGVRNGGAALENFVIGVYLPYNLSSTANITNALIQGCVIDHPTYTTISNLYTTGFIMSGGNNTNGIFYGAVMRDNYINFGTANTNISTHGFTLNGQHESSVMEQNRIFNAGRAIYADTLHHRQCVIQNNEIFSALGGGVFWNFIAGTYVARDIRIANNRIAMATNLGERITPSYPSQGSSQVGIWLSGAGGGGSGGTFTNVVVEGNFVGYEFGGTSTNPNSYAISVNRANNLIMRGNRTEIPVSQITIASPFLADRWVNAVAYDNRHVDGTPYPVLALSATNTPYNYIPNAYTPTIGTNFLGGSGAADSYAGLKNWFRVPLTVSTNIVPKNLVEGMPVYFEIENPSTYTVTWPTVLARDWLGGSGAVAAPTTSTNVFAVMLSGGKTNAWLVTRSFAATFSGGITNATAYNSTTGDTPLTFQGVNGTTVPLSIWNLDTARMLEVGNDGSLIWTTNDLTGPRLIGSVGSGLLVKSRDNSVYLPIWPSKVILNGQTRVEEDSLGVVKLSQASGDGRGSLVASNVFLNNLLGVRSGSGNVGNYFVTAIPTTSLTNTLWTTNGTAGQFLTADGSGALYWSTVSGGGGGAAGNYVEASSGVATNLTFYGSANTLASASLFDFGNRAFDHLGSWTNDSTSTVPLIANAQSGTTTNLIEARLNNSRVWGIDQSGANTVTDTGSLGFADAKWIRNGPGTLAQRNGTQAQTNELWGSYTDNSNYEMVRLSYVQGTGLVVATDTAGTGGDNLSVTIAVSGSGGLVIPSGSADASPGLRFSAAPTVGIRSDGTDAYFTHSSARVGGWRSSGLLADSIAFPDASPDVGIDRYRAGVLQVDNGSSGFGALLQTNIIFRSVDSTNEMHIRGGSFGLPMVYTLPADDGDAGEVLQTDGSGNLSWQPDATGSGGGSGGIATLNGSGTNITIYANGANDVSATIRQISAQTGNLLNFRDSGGALLSYVNTNGALWLGDGTHLKPAIGFTSGSGVGISYTNNSEVVFGFSGQKRFAVLDQAVRIYTNNGAIEFGSSLDTVLQRHTSGQLFLSTSATNGRGELVLTNIYVRGSAVFRDPDASHSVTLKSGAIAADLTATLWTTNPPAGQVLANDGSGNLYWTASSGGSVTGSGTAPQLAVWSGSSALTSRGLYNALGSMLSFGGTSSSFAGFTNAADVIQIRAADGSTTLKNLQVGDLLTGSAAGTVNARLEYDSAIAGWRSTTADGDAGLGSLKATNLWANYSVRLRETNGTSESIILKAPIEGLSADRTFIFPETNAVDGQILAGRVVNSETKLYWTNQVAGGGAGSNLNGLYTNLNAYAGSTTGTNITTRLIASQTGPHIAWQDSAGAVQGQITKDGYLLVPVGSVTTPGIGFNGDADTGISFSSGAFRFGIDGAEQIAFSTSGLSHSSDTFWFGGGSSYDARIYRTGAGAFRIGTTEDNGAGSLTASSLTTTNLTVLGPVTQSAIALDAGGIVNGAKGTFFDLTLSVSTNLVVSNIVEGVTTVRIANPSNYTVTWGNVSSTNWLNVIPGDVPGQTEYGQSVWTFIRSGSLTNAAHAGRGVPTFTTADAYVLNSTNINVNFTTNVYQTWTLTGSSRLNSTNRVTGVRSAVLKLVGHGSTNCNLIVNTSWKFLGTAPTTLAAGKTAILSLTQYGTAESDVVASYNVQP